MTPRIAAITGAYGTEVQNGVGRFLCGLDQWSQANGQPLHVFSSGDHVHNYPGLQNIHALAFPIPGGFKAVEAYYPLEGRRKQLARAIEALDPDVLHVSTPEALGMTGVWVARKQKRPLAGIYHTDFPAFAQQLVRDAVERLLRERGGTGLGQWAFGPLWRRLRPVYEGHTHGWERWLLGFVIRRVLRRNHDAIDDALRRGGEQLADAAQVVVREALALFYGRFQLVIARSEVYREKLIRELYLRDDRVRTLRRGVDVETFSPAPTDADEGLRERLGIPPGVPVVLYVGRVTDEKNVGFLADAWRVYRDQGGGAAFAAAGGGNVEAFCRRRPRRVPPGALPRRASLGGLPAGGRFLDRLHHRDAGAGRAGGAGFGRPDAGLRPGGGARERRGRPDGPGAGRGFSGAVGAGAAGAAGGRPAAGGDGPRRPAARRGPPDCRLLPAFLDASRGAAGARGRRPSGASGFFRGAGPEPEGPALGPPSTHLSDYHAGKQSKRIPKEAAFRAACRRAAERGARVFLHGDFLDTRPPWRRFEEDLASVRRTLDEFGIVPEAYIEGNHDYEFGRGRHIEELLGCRVAPSLIHLDARSGLVLTHGHVSELPGIQAVLKAAGSAEELFDALSVERLKESLKLSALQYDAVGIVANFLEEGGLQGLEDVWRHAYGVRRWVADRLMDVVRNRSLDDHAVKAVVHMIGSSDREQVLGQLGAALGGWGLVYGHTHEPHVTRQQAVDPLTGERRTVLLANCGSFRRKSVPPTWVEAAFPHLELWGYNPARSEAEIVDRVSLRPEEASAYGTPAPEPAVGAAP